MFALLMVLQCPIDGTFDDRQKILIYSSAMGVPQLVCLCLAECPSRGSPIFLSSYESINAEAVAESSCIIPPTDTQSSSGCKRQYTALSHLRYREVLHFLQSNVTKLIWWKCNTGSLGVSSAIGEVLLAAQTSWTVRT